MPEAPAHPTAAEPEGLDRRPAEWLPKELLRRPTLILDSGASVDESVFLEHFRYWMAKFLARRLFRRDVAERKTNIWLIYPDRNQWARHGAKPLHEWDEWEVRPIRKDDRRLLSSGFFSTVAHYEHGSAFYGRVPPWRKLATNPKRRAAAVYLAPNAKDMGFMRRAVDRWKTGWTIPKLYLGHPTRGLPPDLVNFCNGLFCATDAYREKVNGSWAPHRGFRLPWERWWRPDPNPAHDFVIAPNWRHPHRQRVQLRMEGAYRPQDDGYWETVEDATNARIYAILSQREAFPFDALIALAKGATLVAPNTELFRQFPGKKWLFPSTDLGHNRYAWGHNDVRHWLEQRMKHGDD